MRSLVVLLSLLAVAAAVQAQATPTVDAVRDEVPSVSPLDQVGDALSGAGSAVGEAASGVGRGLADAASALAGAVADAVTGTVRLVGDAIAASARGFSDAGDLMATSLADLLVGSLEGTWSGLGAMGGTAALAVVAIASGTVDAVRLIGRGVAAAASAVAAGVTALVAGYLALIAPLRPPSMSTDMFHATATAGAAGSAAAAGWAGWHTLRRWGTTLLGLAGFGVAGFSRIAEDELLEHPLRRQVFDAIQRNPGIHASALAREVGAGWGTIVHHLQKLEKARIVATRMVNNQKCFFEQGGDVGRQDMAVASALKGPMARDIASFIQSHPLSSQKDVAQRLGISPALASFHVKRLVAHGVLDRVREGRSWRLTTTDSFRRVQHTVPMPASRSAAAARAAA